MRADSQENRDQQADVSAGAVASTLPRRIGARILHELRGTLAPTFFFFIGFNFIVLTTNLLVASYAASVSNFMLATIAALASARR